MFSALLAYSAAAQPPVLPLNLPPAALPGGVGPDLLLDAPLLPDLAPEVYPIPPAVMRPLGVDEGERIFVGGFELQGTTARDELGIYLEELDELVESIRLEKQNLVDVGEDGFIPAERNEMLGFLREVVDSPDLDMRFEEYQALVDKLRLDKLQREQGLTIGQLQEVANEVTRYYRRSGFILAQAFIPAQEVRDGKVVIEVVEGKLGTVLAEGNEKFSDELLEGPFAKLLDAPVIGGSIESALSVLADYPGLSAFGVFQPGSAVGTTDLVLKVQDEKTIAASLRADNHGTKFTGNRRMFADLELNNFTTHGDKVRVSLLQSYNPKNSFFGSVEYNYLIQPGLVAGLSYGRNAFDVGGDLRAQEISGISKSGKAFIRHTAIRGRRKNIYAQADLKRTQAQTLQSGRIVSQDDLAVAGLEMAFDRINTKSAIIDSGVLRLDLGLDGQLGAMTTEEAQTKQPPPSRRGGTGTFAGGKFRKATANYVMLKSMTKDQSLIFRLNGQWSPDLLTSTSQFAMGGPDSVRAFPISEYLTDSGLFGSVQWDINAPGFADSEAFDELTWGEVFKMSFFADFASGRRNDRLTSEERKVNISGWGMGMQFSLPGEFSARFQWAHPFGPREASDGDKARYWLDLNYSF